MPSKIRLSKLAGAINVTPKVLQNWFARFDHIRPKAKQEPRAWLEFSWGDVAAFAITVWLIDLGMDVSAAFTNAQTIVERRWPELYDTEEPSWSLTAKSDRIEFDVSNKWWSMADPCEPEESDARIAKGLKNRKEPLRATITLHAGSIVHDAFGALVDAGHQPPKLK